MAQSSLARAQALLKQERYDEAYVILQKINSPTAKRWMAKIDEVYAKQKQASQPNNPFVETVLSQKFTHTATPPIEDVSFEDTFYIKEKIYVSDNKYQAIRIIGGIYRFLGYLTVGIGFFGGIVITVIGTLFSSRNDYYYNSGSLYIGTGIYFMIVCAITGIGLIAFGQIIQVALELNENNRTQVRLLQQMLNKLEK